MVTQTEIANRALQHVGTTAIVAGGLFTEDSKNALEIRNCYDIVRRAELRRNVWRFSIRRCTLRAITPSSQKVVPAAWVITTRYPANAIVSYNGFYYISVINANISNIPDPNSNSSAANFWQLYFGSLYADFWSSAGTNPPTALTLTTGYNSGDLVYYPNTVAAKVYLSIANVNLDTPSLTPPTFALTTFYNPGDFVTASDTNVYVSIWPAGDNVGNDPTSSATYWTLVPAYASGTTYGSGDVTIYSNILYTSLSAGNVGHTPSSSPTFWQVLQPDLAIGKWLLLDASLVQIINPAALYPHQSIFPLPNGFLREAPEDPKAGSTSILGAPSNIMYRDWLFEGPWIISRFPVPPVAFRFVADLTDTSQFDPMFIEGFAARIAKEVCEPITQSTEKLTMIEKIYDMVMGEARNVNGIEIGSEEPPLDDYLACRL